MADRKMHPLVELTRVRFLDFVRTPGSIFWVFVFPVLLAVALGIAFRNQPPVSARVAVVGKAREPIASRLAKAGGVQTLPLVGEEAFEALRKGRIDVLVRAEPTDRPAPAIVYRYDASRPESRQARLAVDHALQSRFGRIDPVAVQDETVTEPGGRYIDFLIPGLIGLNIMSSCMWGIGYTVVDARRRKLLKRFAASPMSRSHFLLSFMLSRLVFLVAEVVALVCFAYLIFDVEVHGSYVGVALFAVLGAFAFSGLSLTIAARPDNTEVASGWMNFAMLPMWLVSGSFFAYTRFPEFLHPAIRLLPLTALNDGLRAVMNDGAAVLGSWMELCVLIAWGAVGFAVALLCFRWK